MIRETSLEAYEKVKPELGIKRRQVLNAIKTSGSTGMTLFELVKFLGRPVNEISGRVTELRKTSMIEESGRRMNPDTLKNAIVWIAKDIG